jgi:ketosteroid isomerase-like protein
MQFRELMQELTEAVIAYDGQRLAKLFTDDGYYQDPLSGRFQGRAEVRRLADEVFKGTLGEMKWDMVDAVDDGRVGYARWVFSFTSRRPGFEGKRVVLRGMSAVELDNGLIKAFQDVYDVGTGFAQLGVPPEAYRDLYAKKAAEIVADPALAAHLQH